MRESVSQSKGVATGPPCKERPDPAAKIGIIYTAFIEAPGLILDAKEIRLAAGIPETQRGQSAYVNAIVQLNNFYELDIRRVKNNRWCLVGRWSGDKYTDYVAARHA